jgi:CRP/FNR family transcriptional regulator, cyclic AMP receptor protein
MAIQAPYGLRIIETCVACPSCFVAELSPETRKALDASSSNAVHPGGATLYVEGQPVRGVFVICNGRVKLSTSSADGKVMILRIAEMGQLIGLPATLSGRPYEVTAETTEPTQTKFIRRDAFLNFLQKHGDAGISAAKLLTDIYFTAYDELRSLGLSHSVKQKVARFILDWSANHAKGHDRMPLAMTHEEIAACVGTTRETVTRALADLKAKEFISLKRTMLEIRNRAGLEEIAQI